VENSAVLHARVPILSKRRKRLESGMYLRHPAADRINIDPGIETIPSLNEGSTMRGDSPAKSAIPFRRCEVLFAKADWKFVNVGKQVNPASRKSTRYATKFVEKRSTLLGFRFSRGLGTITILRVARSRFMQAIQRGRVKTNEIRFLASGLRS